MKRSHHGTASYPPERTLELNRWLKNYSASQGYGFLDYFSAMSDGEGFVKRCLSEDGLHPTPAGYLVMARVAQAGIDSALAS